jgi:hypothetical protein
MGEGVRFNFTQLARSTSVDSDVQKVGRERRRFTSPDERAASG